MMRRTPLKRSGWKREQRRQRVEAAAAQAPASSARPPAPLHRGVIAPPAPPRAAPKTEAHRNSHLRDMARDRPCLLKVTGVCCGDWTTTVAAHSNLSIHGKAGARKANDEYSVWACFTCHSWLDQGKAPGAIKEMAFMTAHLAQVLEWRAIAFDPGSKPRDRSAALWALEHLNATPVAAFP